MTGTNVSHRPQTQSADAETRREALKRFARYAAVAPTTMILLAPTEGQAQAWWWKPRRRRRAPEDY